MKIQDVENQLKETRKLINENSGAIHPISIRLQDAKQRLSEIKREIEGLKLQRQKILADGEDAGPVTDQMQNLEKELELKGEEISGLDAKVKKLQTNEVTFAFKEKSLRIRILHLQSVTIAKKYNELAGGLAGVVRELTTVQMKIDKLTGSADIRGGRVVFGPEKGALKQIPHLFFEDDACSLENFMVKHPELGGNHPNSLTANQGGFFFDYEKFKEEYAKTI